MDDQRARGAALGHDTDDLAFSILGFEALLGIPVGKDQIVHVLGEVVLAEGVPDELVRFLGGRDEHRGRRERQGPCLVAHDDIYLLFRQELLRFFPQLLLYFFHVPDSFCFGYFATATSASRSFFTSFVAGPRALTLSVTPLMTWANRSPSEAETQVKVVRPSSSPM